MLTVERRKLISGGQLGQGWQSLNIPRKMMNGIGRSQNRGATRSKGQAHQTGAGNFERSLAIRRDLDDARPAGDRSRYVEIALDIERQPLRASQSAIEG